MTVYGHIVAILNVEQVLVKVLADAIGLVEPGAKLTIFDSVKDEALQTFGLEQIVAPKGKIQIVMPESEDIYLAAIYMEGGELVDSSLSHFAGMFNSKVRVGARKSANISDEGSLGIEFAATIKVGDPVGRI